MKKLIIIVGSVIILGSCLSSRPAHMPTPDNYHEYTKGHYFKGKYKLTGAVSTIDGELLYLTDTTMILLNNITGLGAFKKSKIIEGDLFLSMITTGKEREKLTKLSSVSTIFTFFHGWFWAITIPLNVGIITAQSKISNKGMYNIKYTENQWDILRKFSRFPAGLPENVPLIDIK